MGISTDAILCYGIAIAEDVELPWMVDEYDNDIEEWWRIGILGFRPSFELSDDCSDEDFDRYSAERRAFDLEHPSLQVEVVEHCSFNETKYILAVPSSVRTAKRGYLEEIVEEDLFVLAREIDDLVAFCWAHGIEVNRLSWWLVSWWG